MAGCGGDTLATVECVLCCFTKGECQPGFRFFSVSFSEVVPCGGHSDGRFIVSTVERLGGFSLYLDGVSRTGGGSTVSVRWVAYCVSWQCRRCTYVQYIILLRLRHPTQPPLACCGAPMRPTLCWPTLVLPKTCQCTRSGVAPRAHWPHLEGTWPSPTMSLQGQSWNQESCTAGPTWRGS